MNKELMIDVTDYKRINVDIMPLGENCWLRFLVDLYSSDGLSLKGFYTNIYMKNNWNLLISGGKDSNFSSKINFCIGYSNLYQFNLLINNALLWLTSKDYADLFYKQDENVYINKAIQIPEISIFDKFEKQRMAITPAVNEKINTGISLLFEESDPIFVLASTVMNLKFFLQTFNPYQYAMEVLNYSTMTAIISSLTEENTLAKPKIKKFSNNTSFDKQGSFLAKTHAVRRDE